MSRTARDDRLKSFSFEAEGACRGLRNSPFVEIFSGRNGVVQIFDRKAKDVFCMFC